MSYLFDPADGKIHTRYTELISCTPQQVWRVLRYREDDNWLSTPSLNHGQVRHAMWAEESLATGRLPACFELPTVAGQRVSGVEQEIVGEILPGVVLHGRVDALMDDWSTVVDYKTVAAPSLAAGRHKAGRYRNSRQLKLYAYLLGLNGHRVRQSRYLVEVWDETYATILGYTEIRQAISLADLAATLAWAEERVATLVSAYDRDGLTSQVLLGKMKLS